MSASISTTTLSLVITFWRGNTYTVSRRSILSVRKWRANESPAGVTITWCQSIARGLSMIGMMRFTPEDKVRWYLPSRSMIIVCACCTIRIPRATIEIANSAIATGTMNEPMLSISALLVHVQRCPIDPHHHDPGAGLDLGAGRVQALQQEGADAREREQRPGGEAQDGRQVSRHHERDRARQHAPHRHAQQPEPRRQDLGDEQQQRGHEPDL